MAREKKPVTKLNAMHHIGYGAGDAGGVLMLMVISYLERFSRNILGIDPIVYAGILVVWNVWDAINDPLVGTFMDFAFSKAKPGSDKFRPWILRSIPILAIGMGSLMTLPTLFDGLLCIVVLFVSKIVFELGYTIMNIGMGSLLGVMATNDAERASLSSARGFGSTVGGMVGMMVLPQILANLGETKLGYAVTAIAAAILGCVLVFIHYAFTVERNAAAQLAVKTEEEKEAEKIKVTDILQVFKVNRPYLALCVHSVCICFVQGVAQGASNYMYADILGDIGLATIASAISMPVMFGGLIVAPILAKKFDLVAIIRTCILVGCIMLVTCFVYAISVDTMNAWVYMPWSGIGTGLVTLSVQLQWGLVGEAIDYNEHITGKRTEGSIYGTFNLSRRIGQTVGLGFSFFALDWIRYDPTLAAQSAGTVFGFKVLCVLVPAVFILGSWAAFKFVWNITPEVRAKIAAWKQAQNA